MRSGLDYSTNTSLFLINQLVQVFHKILNGSCRSEIIACHILKSEQVSVYRQYSKPTKSALRQQLVLYLQELKYIQIAPQAATFRDSACCLIIGICNR